MGKSTPVGGLRRARGVAIAGPVGVGLAIALLVPSAANAASVVSQGDGRLISATVAGTTVLDNVAALEGADAVNTNGSGNVTADTPLDATALSDLAGVALPTTNLFGSNGVIQLGAVGQYAVANSDGSSAAFSGAVSQAPSLIGVDSSQVTASNLGAPSADSTAEIALGNAATDPVAIDTTIGVLAASAKQTADGTQSGQYDLSDLNMTVGGSVVSTALAPINTALSTLLTAANAAGMSITNPLANDQITISLSDLLTAAGVSSINDLPPGTDLLNYVPVAVATQIQTDVNTILTQVQTYANGLSGIVGSVTKVTLNTAITTAQAALNPLLSGLTSSLVAPLSTAVTALGQLQVNNQTKNSDGSFTETALRVGVGPNGSVAAVDLASATVGPNAGIEAAPIVNSNSAGIAGLLLLGGLLAWAAVAYRRRAQRLALAQAAQLSE